MADYHTELKTYLKTISAVTDQVGSGNAARIYPDAAREGAALPYVVIHEAGNGESYQYLGGISGLAEVVYHIYTYGATRAVADALAEIVRLAPLQMYRGDMGSTAARVSASSSRDCGADIPEDSSDQKRYWARRTYRIYFDEVTA